jgi:DNA-binding response OmpR family regulator
VGRITGIRLIYLTGMATNGTVLCIHRDPAQLNLLQENGYELVTATNGSEGFRLLMSRPVDAIVLEYHLGLLDGAVVAAEIRRVKPELPIVMLADHLELPDGALKSVDALVTKADGAHFLWATVHSVLNTKPVERLEAKLQAHAPIRHRGEGTSWEAADRVDADLRQSPANAGGAPFSSDMWKGILGGDIKF